MCSVAPTTAAMVKPWASATAKTSCPAVLIAPIPTKTSAKVPMNSARQGRSLSMPRCNQIAGFLATALASLAAAGVIGIFLAQLTRRSIGLLRFARSLIRRCCFLQRARRDGWIIIKQGHAHERFAGFVGVSAFNLDIAREQSRLGIDASFRLQLHDLLSNLLRFVRLVRANLGGTKREQYLGFAGGISRGLQISA